MSRIERIEKLMQTMADNDERQAKLILTMFDKIERLEQELCTTATTEPGLVVEHRSRSRSRSRSPAPIRHRSPSPVKRGSSQKRRRRSPPRESMDYSVMLEPGITPNPLSAMNHDQLRSIFAPYGSVMKIYMWKHYTMGDVARVRFFNINGVNETLVNLVSILATHGIKCSNYVRRVAR